MVDTCSSKLLECTHHVVELYLSGDSMAHWLPRVGPPSQHLAKKEVPSCMLDLIVGCITMYGNVFQPWDEANTNEVQYKCLL